MTDRPGSPATRLEGRVAIVTGGGSGIGRAACERLAREGARVAVVDLNAERAEETVKALGPEGSADALAMGLDVRSEEDMDAMVARTIERFGRVDILVHAAGILHPPGGRQRLLVEIPTEEWDTILGTNLRGTFLANRAVARAMIRQKEGHIVNLSSTLGRKAEAFESAYCASKFAVIGLSESLAEEVRSYGIKVHAICPGAVDTPLWDQNGAIGAPEFALPPERVADLIAYVLTLPADTVMQNLVLLPFRTRRRRKGAAPVDGSGGGQQGGTS